MLLVGLPIVDPLLGVPDPFKVHVKSLNITLPIRRFI